jgi:hypothetical protein
VSERPRSARAAPPSAASVAAPASRPAPAADRAFDRAAVLVAYHLACGLADVMQRAARALDTDYESLVLWSALARASVGHLLADAADARRCLDADGVLRVDRAAMRPAKLRELADATGIARETVRRKLLGLQEDGRAERVVPGWILGTRDERAALRELARVSLARMDGARRDVDAVLSDEAAARHRARDVGRARPPVGRGTRREED